MFFCLPLYVFVVYEFILDLVSVDLSDLFHVVCKFENQYCYHINDHMCD